MLGFKGPRKMTVLLPGMNQDHKRVEVRPTSVRSSTSHARFTASFPLHSHCIRITFGSTASSCSFARPLPGAAYSYDVLVQLADVRVRRLPCAR